MLFNEFPQGTSIDRQQVGAEGFLQLLDDSPGSGTTKKTSSSMVRSSSLQ